MTIKQSSRATRQGVWMTDMMGGGGLVLNQSWVIVGPASQTVANINPTLVNRLVSAENISHYHDYTAHMQSKKGSG